MTHFERFQAVAHALMVWQVLIIVVPSVMVIISALLADSWLRRYVERGAVPEVRPYDWQTDGL